MTPQRNHISDETHVTELTIAPDGRIYIFGTSRQILDVVRSLRPSEATAKRLLARVRDVEATQPHNEGDASQ